MVKGKGRKKKDVVADMEHSVDAYKEGILEVNNVEKNYDDVFEQKLGKQFKEFEEIKEHTKSIKKLIRVLAIVMILALIALLVLTFIG